MSACSFCKTALKRTDSFSYIDCKTCSQFSHTICANLTRNDVEYFKKNKEAWYCKNCTEKKKIQRRTMGEESLIAVTSADNTANDVQSIVNLIEKATSPNDEDFFTNLDDKNLSLKSLMVYIKRRFDIIEKNSITVKQIMEENKNLKLRVDQLEQRLDKVEQNKMRKSIEILNVPLMNTAKLEDIAASVINKAMDKQNGEDDIEKCFQIKRTKKIIVKLKSTAIKKNLISAMRKKKSLNTMDLFNIQSEEKIYVNECITYYRRELFKQAREKQQTLKYKYLWLSSGQILMKKNDGEKPIHINCTADLDVL